MNILGSPIKISQNLGVSDVKLGVSHENLGVPDEMCRLYSKDDDFFPDLSLCNISLTVPYNKVLI